MTKKEKIDLNAPAFGLGAQAAEVVDDAVAKPAQDEVFVDKKGTDAPVGDNDQIVDDKPNTVKYSRFKVMHDRAIEAEREAEVWRARAEAFSQPKEREESPLTGDVPAYWIELYGNSEASQKAWKIQQRANQELIAEAQQRAIDMVRQERVVEAEQVDENIDKLDNNFEELEALVERDLTDAEQSAVLDIVDEFSPKDNQGNYLGEILPFEKAWEVYEMRQEVAKAPHARSRDGVAALSGRQSQGEAGATNDRDKNFNPLDWNAWRSRI